MDKADIGLLQVKQLNSTKDKSLLINYLSSIEKIIDVLQKALFLNLSVSEEEDPMLFRLGGFTKDHLQVFPPFNRCVAFCNFNLKLNIKITVLL